MEINISTPINELSKEIEDIKEYNMELDKRVVKIQNLITQAKLFEIRKNLETFVKIFEEKITQTNKELNDKHHNLKNLLFDENDIFKLVKVLELEEVKNNFKKVDEEL